jgi:hypothetical protein
MQPDALDALLVAANDYRQALIAGNSAAYAVIALKTEMPGNRALMRTSILHLLEAKDAVDAAAMRVAAAHDAVDALYPGLDLASEEGTPP